MLNLSRWDEGSQMPEVHRRRVSTCGRGMPEFARVTVRRCYIETSDNRPWDGQFERSHWCRMIWEMRQMAGQTKITNAMVTCGVPPAMPRVGDHRRRFRAGAGRCGGPDAASVSATTRGRGRWRQTPQWRDLAAWLRGRVRTGLCRTSSPETDCWLRLRIRRAAPSGECADRSVLRDKRNVRWGVQRWFRFVTSHP